jgi:hypothetical protein
VSKPPPKSPRQEKPARASATSTTEVGQEFWKNDSLVDALLASLSTSKAKRTGQDATNGAPVEQQGTIAERISQSAYLPRWVLGLAAMVMKEGKAIAEKDRAMPRIGGYTSDGEPSAIHRITLEIQTLARELEWKLYWLGQQEYVFHHWNAAAETVKTIREHIESTFDKDLATKVAEMPEAGRELRALKQQRTNALRRATELRKRDAEALKEHVAKLDHEHPNWSRVQMVQELTSQGVVHMNKKPYTPERIGQIRNELRREARAQRKSGR